MFDCTAGQIAREVKLSEERVKKILQRLEKASVIKTVRPAYGRGHPALRLITSRPFRLKKSKPKGGRTEPP